MSKHKQLAKILIRQGIICLVLIGVFVGIYFVTDDLADDSAKKKGDAETALKQDQGKITTMNTQIEKSSLAESRFEDLQKDRDALDFSINSDTFKEWLRNAKAQYRLSNNFKLSLTPEKKFESKEIPDAYEVYEHPGMKLEFSAMSDTHVFAFLQSLVRSAPGFIRIETFSIKRNGDLDPATIDQIKTGHTPYMVDAKIEFNWVGLREKPKPVETIDSAKPGTTPAPAKKD